MAKSHHPGDNQNPFKRVHVGAIITSVMCETSVNL